MNLGQTWFGGHTLVASQLGNGHSWALTEFRIGADGFERMLVIAPPGTTDTRAGRITQRLLELETYRLMALRGLPVAKALGPMLSQAESALSDITALLCDGDTLEAGHLEQALMSGRRPAAHPMGQSPAPPDSAACAGPGQDMDARKVPHPPRGLRDIEYAALRERAALHRGSRAALAAELGISERSLYRKLKAAGAA